MRLVACAHVELLWIKSALLELHALRVFHASDWGQLGHEYEHVLHCDNGV